MAEPAGNNGNPEASTGTGILNDVWDAINHKLRTSDATSALVTAKQITFSNAANLGAIGSVPLFTVTGDVLLTLVGYCNTGLAGASATIAHGISGNTGLLIASITGTTLVAGKAVDKTGLIANGTAPFVTPIFALYSQNIIATIATANLTGGIVDYVAYWLPLTPGATVV